MRSQQLSANETDREGYLKGLVANQSDANLESNYGSGGCISTYVSAETGTCIVKTKCKDQEAALKDFDVGMTCVEESGASTRHTFGTNSFTLKKPSTPSSTARCALGWTQPS